MHRTDVTSKLQLKSGKTQRQHADWAHTTQIGHTATVCTQDSTQAENMAPNKIACKRAPEGLLLDGGQLRSVGELVNVVVGSLLEGNCKAVLVVQERAPVDPLTAGRL